MNKCDISKGTSTGNCIYQMSMLIPCWYMVKYNAHPWCQFMWHWPCWPFVSKENNNNNNDPLNNAIKLCMHGPLGPPHTNSILGA